MGEQLTTNAAALRLFFTDDIYLVSGDETVPRAEEEVLSITSADVPKSSPEIASGKTVFKYLGKNQKNVLILVNDKENEVSSEGGKELLRNIVKAIQLSANDFALLNYSDYEGVKLIELVDFFSSKLIMVFGVSAIRLGLQEYPKNVWVMKDSIQIVFSDNLDLLIADQAGKKILWGSLKQLSI